MSNYNCAINSCDSPAIIQLWHVTPGVFLSTIWRRSLGLEEETKSTCEIKIPQSFGATLPPRAIRLLNLVECLLFGYVYFIFKDTQALTKPWLSQVFLNWRLLCRSGRGEESPRHFQVSSHSKSQDSHTGRGRKSFRTFINPVLLSASRIIWFLLWALGRLWFMALPCLSPHRGRWGFCLHFPLTMYINRLLQSRLQSIVLTSFSVKLCTEKQYETASSPQGSYGSF